MNKFRASFSVLSQWDSGNTDRAVEMYFKLKSFTTRSMAEGKEWHEKWEQEVKKSKCLPMIFGGYPLNKPQTELKIVRQLDTWLKLVGKLDLVDGKTIWDYKTGVTPSERYANSWQPRVYQLLYPSANRAVILHYNQINKKVDTSIVHLTDKSLEKVINWTVTLASEMHNYLTENHLYERFGHETK